MAGFITGTANSRAGTAVLSSIFFPMRLFTKVQAGQEYIFHTNEERGLVNGCPMIGSVGRDSAGVSFSGAFFEKEF